mmetsp:Transcript_36820/g.79817  ORF Transcript_36820/g.79817 Transcript_36820/m.79817 type:complete len:841 (+) Transcript_36820:116-2638(+)
MNKTRRSLGRASTASGMDTPQSGESTMKGNSKDSSASWGSGSNGSFIQRIHHSSSNLIPSTKSSRSPNKGSVPWAGSTSFMDPSSSSILESVGQCSESAWKNQPTFASEMSMLTASDHAESLIMGAKGTARAFCAASYLLWRRYIKICFTMLVVLVHIYLMSSIWSADLPYRPTDPSGYWTYTIGLLFLITLPLLFWLCFEWIRNESSFMARQASWFFLFTWMSHATILLCMVYAPAHITWSLTVNVGFGRWAFTMLAIWARVSTAEKAFSIEGAIDKKRRRGSAYYIMVILFLPLPLTIATDVPYLMCIMRPEIFAANRLGLLLYLRCLTLAAEAARMILFGVVGWIVWSTFSRMLVPLQYFPESMKKSKKFLGSEVEWAKPVVKRVRLALTLLCLAGMLYNAFIFWIAVDVTSGRRTDKWVRTITVFEPHTSLWIIVDFITLLMIVSCFKSQKPAIDETTVSKKELASHQSQDRAARPEWHQTVKKLAQRYITAAELLDFYRELQKVMPHFNPEKHTMNDIVKGVIIPKSRTEEQGGSAYADLLEKRRRETQPACTLYAQRMVTHEWRNLFLHTVAAVLADALDQKEYGQIAVQLTCHGGTAHLASRLEQCGTAKRRYWMCSFCVNQHRGICGSAAVEPPADSPEYPRYKANTCDSVTGKRHSVCNCCEPKLWDGDDCEMNKFDDLMALLSCKVPSFGQVVAIDRNFGLFSRIWCVAELVEACRLQIDQNVSLPWKRLFDANTGDIGTYMKLAMISVKDCSAALEKDKISIMKKIENSTGIEEFDAQLQATIFGDGGLLSKDLMGFDVIHSASRAALRAQVAIAQAESRSLAEANSAV